MGNTIEWEFLGITKVMLINKITKILLREIHAISRQSLTN